LADARKTSQPVSVAPAGEAPVVPDAPRTVAEKKASTGLREAAIIQALDKSVELAYTDVSLDNAIEHLARQLKVPLWIDRATLTDEAVALDQPVTIHQSGITGRSALKLVLNPVSLDWVVADEVLKVTTSSKVAESLDTRVYDVFDLVAIQDERGIRRTDFQPLIDALVTTVTPDSWEETNGPGSVQKFNSGGIAVLSVLQTQRVHEQIFIYLDELRRHRRPGATTTRVNPGDPHSTSRPRPRPAMSARLVDPRIAALVSGNNQFAIDIYRRLAQDHIGNLFVSPLGISYTMAMVYAGAHGETAREMATAMRFLLRQGDLPAAFGLLYPTIRTDTFRPGAISVSLATHGDAELRVANRLWALDGTEFLDPFSDSLEVNFNAHLQNLNSADRVSAARTVNDWVKEATDGMIPLLLTPDDISEISGLLLTNAMTFVGKWSRPFDRKLTAPARFATESSKIMVEMMCLEADSARYADDDGLQILERPYGDGGASMTILLPDSNAGALAKLESALSDANLARWMAIRDSDTTDVYLPRFKLESGYSLRAVLESLGMTLAFRSPGADFSGVARREDLFLSDVVQRAYVEVDEQGTRAAAATGTMYMGKGAPVARTVFRADHPFLFVIRDNRTGSILFIGRVANPGDQGNTME
jgi:serpin B